MAREPNHNPKMFSGGAAGGKDPRRKQGAEPRRRASSGSDKAISLNSSETDIVLKMKMLNHFKTAITQHLNDDGSYVPQEDAVVEVRKNFQDEYERRKETFEELAGELKLNARLISEAEIKSDAPGAPATKVARYSYDAKALSEFINSQAVLDVTERERAHEYKFSEKNPSDYRHQLMGHQAIGDLVRMGMNDLRRHVRGLIDAQVEQMPARQIGPGSAGERAGNKDHENIAQHRPGGRDE